MVSAPGGGSQSLSFVVQAWTGWLPGRADLASGGRAVAESVVPAGLRRRATPLGRKVLEAAWPLLDGTPEPPRIVLASRHGEYQRTWQLAASLAAEDAMSPADFSLSIHHGLAALLSIATGNTAGHTALAGCGDTFGFGCVEAACCLADGDSSVLLLYFDEALPDCYGAIADGTGAPAVLALLLSPPGRAGQSISVEFAPADAAGHCDLAARFAGVLTGQEAEARAVGERMTWRWRRAA
jgi:hypothetical protein